MRNKLWTLMVLAFALGVGGACSTTTAPDRIPQDDETQKNRPNVSHLILLGGGAGELV